MKLRLRGFLTSMAVMALLLGVVGQANAAAITITNPSFELPDVSSCSALILNCNVNAKGNWTSGNITGWTVSGTGGVFRPVSVITPTDGSQVAWSAGGAIYQILSAPLTANMIYTLTVDVGDRSDTSFGGYSVQLRAGNPSIFLAGDTNTLSPSSGFLTSTVTFTAFSGDPNLGLPLVVALYGSGSQTIFDNVRLDASPAVPEPGTLLLIGSGLVGIGVGARRRRK